MNYDIIKYGECHHIGNCINKYIDVFIPYKPKIQRIKVCSEYFRLMIGEKMTGYIISEYSPPPCQMFLYSYVISDIINELFVYEEYHAYNEVKLINKINPNIPYQIVYRPKMYGGIRLFDAIKVICEVWNETGTFYDYYGLDDSNDNMVPFYMNSLYGGINRSCSYLMQHKKYAYQESKIKRILNIINNNQLANFGNPNDVLNELVLIFFEIQINLLQNDTSKQ